MCALHVCSYTQEVYVLCRTNEISNLLLVDAPSFSLTSSKTLCARRRRMLFLIVYNVPNMFDSWQLRRACNPRKDVNAFLLKGDNDRTFLQERPIAPTSLSTSCWAEGFRWLEPFVSSCQWNAAPNQHTVTCASIIGEAFGWKAKNCNAHCWGALALIHRPTEVFPCTSMLADDEVITSLSIFVDRRSMVH